ncbi:hypothetical protein ABIE26_002518 [Pedobacter africanus]|uniref:Uncharacterized protein n=1 Tax=Pedobacter africanus TaxID=151894 RepID=A0ACC6KXK8_9SPHI|nr:hypothetical protein [Pedobacter africanus]
MLEIYTDRHHFYGVQLLYYVKQYKSSSRINSFNKKTQ